MRTWILSSSALILLTLGLRALLKGRLSLRLRYALWLPVLLRLLIPVSFWSISQLTRTMAADTAVIGDPIQRREYAVQESREQAVQSLDEQGEWTLIQAVPDVPDQTDSAETITAAPEEPAFMETASVQAQPLRLPTLLPWIWAGGAGVILLATLGSELRFSLRLCRSRQQMEDIDAQVPVYSCPWLKTPCLAGIFRPAVYLPASLRGDEPALRHALAHEQAHLRHGDLLWCRLRCLALALHWYNPLAWLAALLSKRDGELACDEGAIARLGETQRLPYGRSLIRLSCADRLDLLRPVPAMGGGEKSLRERVRLIARGPKTTAWALVLALSVSLFATGCSFSEKKPEQTGPFYESEYQTLDLYGDDVTSLFYSGDRFYAAVTADIESGGMESRLFSLDPDGDDRREISIPIPTLSEIPEDADLRSFFLSRGLPGPDGSILALCDMLYSVPYGDEVRLEDGTTTRMEDWRTLFVVLHLSAEGEILDQFPISGELGYIQPQSDAQGNLYLVDEGGRLSVYDPKGRKLLNLQPSQHWEQLVRLNDGRVAAVLPNGSAMEVHAIDPESGGLELIVRIPEQLGITVYPGAFGWDVLVNNGTMLYGLNAAGERGTVVTWLNCDLNGNELLDVVPGDDGETIRAFSGLFMKAAGISAWRPSGRQTSRHRKTASC